MTSIPIQAYTLSCSLGIGMTAIRAAIASGNSGLNEAPWPDCDVPTWFGRVSALDQDRTPLAAQWESRNNQLAALGLQQDQFFERAQAAIEHYGADRCAVIIGTSTSSIGRTESGFNSLNADGRFTPNYRQPEVHNPNSPTAFVAASLGCRGPTATVSTACSSSAKVFASAARWLAADIADAIIIGGVDSLCLSVIYGFHALQLVAPEMCRPFDRDRNGINLGEAAGFALVTRDNMAESAISLTGYGESLDAYHMSSAHPEGLGARLAMEAAIGRSGIEFGDVEYLNLHGTGTRGNDAVEGLICNELFPSTTMMSATKGWTGHTLGAAGIVEAVLCMDALTTGLIPGTINTSSPEDSVADRLLMENRQATIRRAMTNSFGFGGNNASLIFEIDAR